MNPRAPDITREALERISAIHPFRSTVLILLLTVSSLSAATHYVSLQSTNPAPPYVTWDTAATNIQDAVNVAATNDVVMVTNGVYPGSVTVTNPLALLSVNGAQVTQINGRGTSVSLVNGVSLTGFTVTNGEGVYCASLNAFLTNCVLAGNSGNGGAYGCTLYNCALVGNSPGGGASYSSLVHCTLTGNFNGYSGGGAYYCTLTDCTLSGNHSQSGGGAYGSTLTNCTLMMNRALFSVLGNQQAGGGACNCTLYNCLLTQNYAEQFFENTHEYPGLGGGACGCTLYNCTLAFNSSGTYGGGACRNLWTGTPSTLYNCILVGNTTGSAGGGAYYSTLNNCVFYSNSATNGPDYDNQCTLSSCTVTNPTFISYSSNLRLQPDSPCVNAGNNAYAHGTTDLDGRPRIVGGTVDIGAYEFQPDVSGVFIGWLQSYGLPTDGSADFIDSDHDGMNNWQEWICGTDPTNPASVLKMLAPSNSLSGVTLTWQSVNGKTYSLQRSRNLLSQPAFLSIQSNIVGQASITSFIDTNAIGDGPYFYRVGVQQ